MLHISPCVDFYFSLTDNPYLRLITENGSSTTRYDDIDFFFSVLPSKIEYVM